MSNNSVRKENKSLISKDFNVKIIYPANPSTVLAEKLEILFSVNAESLLSKNDIEFVLSRKGIDELCGSLVKSFVVVSSSSAFETVYKAILDLSEYLPDKDQSSLDYKLKIVSKDGSFERSSNLVNISFTSKSSFDKTYAGYLSPLYAFHSGRYLPILLWGVKKNFRLYKAEIFSNSKKIKVIDSFVPLPQVFNSLPGLTVSSNDCGVSTILKRDEFDRQSSSLKLSAKLYFSGPQGEVTEELSLPKVSCSDEKSGGLKTNLDNIHLDQNGSLVLSGNYFSNYFKRPKFIIRTLGNGLTLKEFTLEELKDGAQVTFLRRDDIFVKNISSANRLDFGFELTIKPEIFGETPGLIAVYLEENAKEVPLGNYLSFLKAGSLYSKHAAANSFSNLCTQRLRSLTQTPNLFYSKLKSTKKSKTQIQKKEQAIVFCASNLSAFQGAPKVLLEAGKELKDKSVKKILISSYGGELREEFEKLGFEIHIIKELFPQPFSFDSYITGLEKAASLLINYQVSNVLANTIDCFWGVRLARYTESLDSKIEVSWFIHESTPPELAHLSLDFRERVHFLESFSKTDNFIFVSKSSEKIYSDFLSVSSLTGSTSKVIPNGVDVSDDDIACHVSKKALYRKELNLSNKFTFLSLGTICKRKGQDILVSALSDLNKSELDEMQFVFVGANPSEFLNDLEEQIKRLNLENNIKIIPETKEAFRYLASADAFIISSREESAPLVSLEASLWSLPIISSNVNGLSEQLEDNKNALLFSPNDSKVLSSLISKVYSSKELRDSLGSSARENVEKNFNLQEIRKSYREIFTSL